MGLQGRGQPARTGAAAALAVGEDGRPDPRRHLRVLERLVGVPATTGNHVERLLNGDQIFPAMLEAIRGAEHTVDFMTYVFWRGDIARTFAEALCERARAGIRVRVVLDSFGTRPMDDALAEDMRRAGVSLVHFHPYRSLKLWKLNLRTHRRVLVCDETVAFTGGVGIAQEWVGDASGPGEWRDTHFRVRGPAVEGVHAAFYSDWLETTHPLLDSRDRFPERQEQGSMTVQTVRAASQTGWNDVALTMRGLIDLAGERLRITSGFFRPNNHFVRLLCDAASRGVQVQVLVPGPHADPVVARWVGESVYEELLDGGVELWRYQQSMHHGKIITVDGLVALVGTANFDARSMALNEQLGLVVHDRGLTGQLDADFDEDLGHSRRVDPDQWRARGRLQRAGEVAADVGTYVVRGAWATRH